MEALGPETFENPVVWEPWGQKPVKTLWFGSRGTKKPWKNNCLDVYVDHKINMNSDHFPLIAEWKFTVANKKKKDSNRVKLDYSKVTEENKKEINRQFQIQMKILKDTAEEGGQDKKTIGTEKLAETLVKAVVENVPVLKGKIKKKWITQQTEQKMEERDRAFVEGNQSDYKALNKEVKK